MPQDTNRPEPYATLLDLIDEHGLANVLQDLANHCEFTAEEDTESGDVCQDCIKNYTVASIALEALADRFDAACDEHEDQTSYTICPITQ
jgi:hypothetical protein